MRGWAVGIVGLVVALFLLPATTDAQTTVRKWQVEGFGGLSLFELPASGEAALPPTGPSLPTSGPTNPSRRIPTWFLGDGASLLNGTNADFGVAGRLVPLDDALGSLGLSGSHAPVAGLRLRRELNTRWWLEVGTEVHTGAADLDPDLLDAIELSRASFASAFTGLFTTGPFINVDVDAISRVTGTSSRELAVTAAVRYTLAKRTLTPYVLVGAGLVHRLGDLPTATLTGTYDFTVATSSSQSRFTESDTLTLRFEQGTALVGIAGAGLQHALTDRLGLAIDGRASFGAPALTLQLDSTPSVTTRSPGSFVESFTTPAVQFSSNPSTGRDSTLSGAPLTGFKAFSTSGLQIRYLVTAGIVVRF